MFRPRRDDVTGKWRTLHSEELDNLFSFPDNIMQIKSRIMGWVERREKCTGEERKVYKVLVGKPNGKRQLARSSYKWEDRVRIDVRGIGYRDLWRAPVNTAMNYRVLEPRS
jgi:hypothetical protein